MEIECVLYLLFVYNVKGTTPTHLKGGNTFPVDSWCMLTPLPGRAWRVSDVITHPSHRQEESSVEQCPVIRFNIPPISLPFSRVIFFSVYLSCALTRVCVISLTLNTHLHKHTHTHTRLRVERLRVEHGDTQKTHSRRTCRTVRSRRALDVTRINEFSRRAAAAR